jgi:geranylgeranyl diphosphate synthase type I
MLKYLGKGAYEDFVPVVKHQIEVGGKRIRPAFALICCQTVGGNYEKALIPAALIELIHNYSLIMDDIIDRGEIRRGAPTVRAKYGDAMALLAMAFYREVLDEIAESCPKPNEMRALMIQTIKEMIEGERLDVLFEQAGRREEYIVKHRYANVPLDLYLDMIGKKTAGLIKAACVAGAMSADASEAEIKALSEYGWNVGLAFQVIDDFLDIFGEKTGKQRGKDIIEHKLGNVVVIFAAEEMTEEEKEEFLSILRSEKIDESKMNRALQLISGTNAKRRTRELAQKLVSEGKEKLKALPDSAAKKALEELADFVVNRLY